MGTGVMYSCLLILSFCCLLHCSAAYHEKKNLPTAMVVGTVFCDTCFHQKHSKSTYSISGASVAIECGYDAAKSSFRKEVKTNRHGVFRVHLPPEVGRHIKTMKACSVKLVKSSEPFCAVPASVTSSDLRLKARRNGLHVFSAGFFTFKPLKQPELCYQKPEVAGLKRSGALADQKQAQPDFFFPAPPVLPSPSTGGVALQPNPLLPPNPLQPPSVRPPVLFPPFTSIPQVPSVTPPPPLLSLNLPPLPFLPNPLIPGIPQVIPSKSTSP